MNDQTNTNAAATETRRAPQPKTLDQRIEDAQATVDRAKEKLFTLTKQRDDAAKYENIERGDVFTFEYGRGEKKRNITGTVVIAEKGKGASNKVRFTSGEGFDAIIVDVLADAINFSTGSRVGSDAEPEVQA